MEALTGKRKELLIFGNDYQTPDGTGVRDYIHVTDLAVGHLMAFDYLIKQKQNLIVSLGTNEGARVLEMVQQGQQIRGKRLAHRIVDRRLGDNDSLLANPQNAMNITV